MNSDYRRMISLVKPHTKTLALAFVAMFLNSTLGGLPIIGLIIPFVDSILAGKPIYVPHYDYVPAQVYEIVQRVNDLPKQQLLNGLIILTIITSFFRVFFEYWQSYFMNDVSQRVIRDLRNQVYNKIINQSISFFGRSQAGALVSRITNDTTVIRDAISEGLTDFLFQPIQILVHLFVLLTVKFIFGVPWTLVLVVFVLLPLIIYPVFQVGRRLKKISRSTQEQNADINSTLFETISGIRIVKGFAMESYEENRFARQNNQFYKTMMMSIGRMILVSPLTEFIGFICLGVVLWIGGDVVIKERMSPGAFLAFLMALFSLLRPFKRLSRVHGINQHALAAAERIFEIMDTPVDVQEKPGSPDLKPIAKGMEFKDIHFSYDKKKEVLRGINFSVGAGEIVAVVGPSGAGKTSLMSLLPRFYDPQEGSILIDGVNISGVSLKSLRAQIGVVTQETILFNDSVAANIAYGQKAMSFEKIQQAAHIANADGFIRRMPKGYDTVIGDRGFRLSGGERQRLSIARAVLKNPPILILDEATSALDTESEMLVQQAVHNLMQGRTVLVIAHRLSTVKDAHRILVLNDGVIEDFGTHEQLMAKSGLYQRLYNLQFRD